MPTYYDILGVEADASPEEIKRAYHAIMKRHHPDQHGQQADPLSRLANKAYAVLKDPRSRIRYDTDLVSKFKRESPPPPPRSAPPKARPPEPVARTTVSSSSTSAKTAPPPPLTNLSQHLVSRKLVTCEQCAGKGTVFLRQCPNCGGLKTQPAAPRGRQLCLTCAGWGVQARSQSGLSAILSNSRLSGPNCTACQGTGLAPVQS